jgi:hypothetical protein
LRRREDVLTIEIDIWQYIAEHPILSAIYTIAALSWIFGKMVDIRFKLRGDEDPFAMDEEEYEKFNLLRFSRG